MMTLKFALTMKLWSGEFISSSKIFHIFSLLVI